MLGTPHTTRSPLPPSPLHPLQCPPLTYSALGSPPITFVLSPVFCSMLAKYLRQQNVAVITMEVWPAAPCRRLSPRPRILCPPTDPPTAVSSKNKSGPASLPASGARARVQRCPHASSGPADKDVFTWEISSWCLLQLSGSDFPFPINQDPSSPWDVGNQAVLAAFVSPPEGGGEWGAGPAEPTGKGP